MTNGNSDDNAVPYHSIAVYQMYTGHSSLSKVSYTLFLLSTRWRKQQLKM